MDKAGAALWAKAVERTEKQKATPSIAVMKWKVVFMGDGADLAEGQNAAAGE